ncbi:MAG: hypothetical protein AMS22_07645 [Thiotrichales bacterium SG8_50]|nr:MAG: hypothetical protein AMS22_07645 [Thiotrichales bacterium SG8_50]
MDVRKILIKTSWRALVPTALINIPVIGIIFLLLAYPVFSIFPEMKQTGPGITYVYASAFLVSLKAWLVFYTYYFLLIFIASIFYNYVRFWPKADTKD